MPGFDRLISDLRDVLETMRGCCCQSCEAFRQAGQLRMLADLVPYVRWRTY